MRLFDIDVVPITCPHCGEGITDDNVQNDDETCTSCYVNARCPAQCNADHDPPTFRQANGSGWECPDTGETFWYHGPNRLADRHRGEWHDYESVLVRDIHGTRVWIDRDDAYWCDGCDGYCHADNYAGDDYCQSCHDDRYHDDYCDCPDCDGGSEPVGDPQPTICASSRCARTPTHWHPISEAVYCGDHAEGSPDIELIPQLIAA